jgi:hypothetical protein
MAHPRCMLDNYGYKHTFRPCNTCYFSTATTVTRTHLNLTLHVHCVSCVIFTVSLQIAKDGVVTSICMTVYTVFNSIQPNMKTCSISDLENPQNFTI